jgi:hypothetical protein
MNLIVKMLGLRRTGATMFASSDASPVNYLDGETFRIV